MSDYEYDKGKYITIEQDDLEKIKLESTRTIKLIQFVNQSIETLRIKLDRHRKNDLKECPTRTISELAVTDKKIRKLSHDKDILELNF